MKVKYFFVLLFCLITGLSFAQLHDPDIYSLNPNVKWTFVNNSANEVVIRFKNNVEFRLDPNGGYRWFTPRWLIDTIGYRAETDYISGYSYVYTSFPSGRRYWLYNYSALNQNSINQVWNGLIAVFYDAGNEQNSRLSGNPLVEQPLNSVYCGVACIQMVENYYFNRHNSLDSIWNNITYISSLGRRIGATYLIAQYLESRNLSTSIVRFSDLNVILSYCEAFQIPAIMNIRAGENSSEGHFVVFSGYSSETGFIRIKDPADRNRLRLSYRTLEQYFTRLTSRDEIGGNTIIIASDKFIIPIDLFCSYCGYKNVIDELLIDAISGLICINCDNSFSVQ